MGGSRHFWNRRGGGCSLSRDHDHILLSTIRSERGWVAKWPFLVKFLDEGRGCSLYNSPPNPPMISNYNFTRHDAYCSHTTPPPVLFCNLGRSRPQYWIKKLLIFANLEVLGLTLSVWTEVKSRYALLNVCNMPLSELRNRCASLLLWRRDDRAIYWAWRQTRATTEKSRLYD